MPLKLEHVVVPRVLQAPGLELWFETEPETHQRFAHIRLLDGRVFGKAAWLRAHIPRDTWMSIAPDQQPAVTWYLRRHVGFVLVERRLIDGAYCDVLWRPSLWGGK